METIGHGFPLSERQEIKNGDCETQPVGTDSRALANAAFVHQEFNSVPIVVSNGVGTLKFGATDLPQASTRYLSTLGCSSALTTESLTHYYVNELVTLSKLYVSASALAPAGQTCVITVRKNAADTSMTATITDAVQDTSDLANTVTLVPGDRFAVKAVTSATFGSTNDIKVSLVAKITGTNIGAGLILLNSTNVVAPTHSAESHTNTTSPSNLLLLPVPEMSIGHSYEQTGTVDVSVNGAAATPIGGTVYSSGVDLVTSAGNYILFPTSGTDPSVGSVSTKPTRARHLKIPGLIPFACWNQPQNTTHYAGGWSVMTSSTTEADVSLPISAGVIKNLRVELHAAPAAGQTVVVTVRKNGVNTALTCTVTDAGTRASDTVNTVSWNAGDKLSISSVISAAAGNKYVGISVEHLEA